MAGTQKGRGCRRGVSSHGFAALALFAELVGCDPSSYSTPIPTECAAAGTQCQLPNGPLGVCTQVPCPADADSLCYACASQH